MSKKFVALRVLNVVLLVSARFQAGTGILAWVHAIPTGNFFVWAHPINGLILVALILVHLALNWQWIVANYFRRVPHPAPAQPAPTPQPAAQV